MIWGQNQYWKTNIDSNQYPMLRVVVIVEISDAESENQDEKVIEISAEEPDRQPKIVQADVSEFFLAVLVLCLVALSLGWLLASPLTC